MPKKLLLLKPTQKGYKKLSLGIGLTFGIKSIQGAKLWEMKYKEEHNYKL